MVKTEVKLRLDREMMLEFAQFCEDVGMSVNTAITLFVRKTLEQKQIPFAIGLGTTQEPPVVPEKRVPDLVNDDDYFLLSPSTTEAPYLYESDKVEDEQFPHILKCIIRGRKDCPLAQAIRVKRTMMIRSSFNGWASA